MDAGSFLQKGAKQDRVPVYAIIGDEDYLRTESLALVRKIVLGKADPELATSTLDGATVATADVLDELATLPMLTPHRLVILESVEAFLADEKHRTDLEDYLTHPSASGTLVMVTPKWNKSWRLHKAASKVGEVIECKAMKSRDMVGWAVRLAKRAHGKVLGDGAARLLVELVGEELGQAAAEIAKLASYVGDRERIAEQDVDQMVAGARVRTSWELMDAIADGRAPEAMRILDRLLMTGDRPVAILGALSWQLRRMVRAGHLMDAGQGPRQVTGTVGVPPFAADAFVRRVRRMGSARLDAAYRRLLDADLQVKRTSALSDRAIVERWLLHMVSPSSALAR